MFIFCMEERKKALLQKNTLQEKSNMKSPAMYPSRKDNIPNQDKSILGIQKYQFLPSHVPPFSSGFKLLINEENDDNPETTDTSRTDKDDTPRTN